MTDTCYATHSVGSGYESYDTAQCELPIEHNADGSWHEAAWTNDDEAVFIRWANTEPTCVTWPRVPGPFDGEAGQRLLAMLRAPLVLDRLPVAMGGQQRGSTIRFRRFASISPATP